MSIKLIATDLDGTLMSGDHLTVSPRTVAALQAAHDRGVCLAIATGRTLDFIEERRPYLPAADPTKGSAAHFANLGATAAVL